MVKDSHRIANKSTSLKFENSVMQQQQDWFLIIFIEIIGKIVTEI